MISVTEERPYGDPKRDTDGRLDRGAITASRGLRLAVCRARGSSWQRARHLGEAERLPLALRCSALSCVWPV